VEVGMTLATSSVKLDPGIRERIQRLAASRQRSANWLMREAIREYVEREEQRDQAHRDALAAWAAYQETGAHVTAAAAERWLARLEAGETPPPPECPR
jgi:predicted transcriptional regulator